jgi:two-component system chemotaxis response regulator CheB
VTVRSGSPALEAGGERPLRVVVADDSPFVCRLLASYLGSAPGVEVLATALDGECAVTLVRDVAPDVVTLDLEMPRLDGLAALGRIMAETPTPVVVISGVSGRAAGRTLAALEAGAVDFVLKCPPGGGLDPEALRAEIVAKVRAAAGVRVIRTLVPRRAAAAPARPGAAQRPVTGQRPGTGPVPAAAASRRAGPRLPPGGVVVIGASTGGPVAVRELLSDLPADFPAAVLLVQHLPATFTRVLAAQLARRVPLAVREACEGDELEPATVLVAPGGYQLIVRPDLRVGLVAGEEVHGHSPAVDVTMQAAAQAFGGQTRGVVLTGMGSDGVQGLSAIRARGGRTFAQDAASCVVAGMPQRAIERGLADAVGSPREIARLLAAGIPAPARPERREAC